MRLRMDSKRSLRLVLPSLLTFALVLSACGTVEEGVDEATAPAEEETTAPAEEADPADEGDEAATPYYEGETITIFVPFDPGGGADTTARIMQPWLEEFIPGNPTVIVRNMGGGGSITGANYWANQEPRDGTSILLSSGSTHTAFALSDPTVDFDFNDMRPVIGFPFGGAMFVHAGLGIEEPADFLETRDEPLIFGARNPTGGVLRRLLTMDAMELEYEPIFGYESTTEVTLAFERGEVDISTDSALPYIREIVPQVEAGEVVPVMSTGLLEDGELVRVPAIPDLPHPGEVYEMHTGEPAEGMAWEAMKLLVAAGDSLSKAMWFHADAPEEAVQEVQEALYRIFEDPDAREDLEEDLAGNEPLFDQELEEALDLFRQPDPEVQEWLQQYLIDRWDYDPADFGL